MSSSDDLDEIELSLQRCWILAQRNNFASLIVSTTQAINHAKALRLLVPRGRPPRPK